MERARVLFVDDEPNIRLTMPAILKMHKFDVTTCATVTEALVAMQGEKFDVLIADLNIGQPGDGFTVVSAMRRTQPDAVTIILTGYPAFETALQAIRSQVDDYLVKPANVNELVDLINQKLTHHTPVHHIPVKNVGTILSENKQSILDEWMTRIKSIPAIADLGLSDTDLLNHTPSVLDELVHLLKSREAVLSDDAQGTAVKHGRTRLRQRLTIPLMLEETRVLRESIYLCIHKHMLSVDISQVFTDMVLISGRLDEHARTAVEAYINSELKAA
jgi:YesN/AraC family two-component response regulator